jgi:hypothetical protein
VHDIDLKDERFARAETDGIERVLAAIAAAHSDDDVRLTRGAQLFDDLYTLFSKFARLIDDEMKAATNSEVAEARA